jgi:hypothetical protein
VKDQPLRTVDDVIEEIKHMSIEEIASEPWEGPHLITVDVLRAAGALDIPPAWRKSLGDEPERYPLFGDDDADSDEDELTPNDGDGEIADGDREMEVDE